MLAFFAIFRPLTGNKTSPNYFFLVEEVLSFDLVGHMWKLVKNWPQEWVFNIYKWKLGRSRWIAYFENYLQKWFGDRYGEFPAAFPARFSRKISRKIFPQDFPARFSRNNFPQDFPATISRNNFPQQFPTRNFPQEISRKIFLQQFPTINSHKIFPQQFPARFSRKKFPTRISHKNFPQDFPARFSRKIFPQDFPKLHPDWLNPHHPIPNAKFPPITAFLKLAFSPPPCPARFSQAGSWLVGSPSPYSKC